MKKIILGYAIILILVLIMIFTKGFDGTIKVYYYTSANDFKVLDDERQCCNGKCNK